MKTSGTLRYIDKDDLTTSLQKYYDVLLARASRDAEGAEWASNCDTQLDLQRPAQKQMLELIKLIKKEYHLG